MSSTDPDLAAGLTAVANAVRDIVYERRRCCVTCTHFNQRDELCMHARPPARPPARVLAYACPAYESDDIPF